MNKSVVTIATATSFLLAGGIAQASVKNASVKPAKITSKSTSVKGTATKSATIKLSRYNTTYAYGKATSKGKFSFKLKHKLHAGWSYRLTVSKKGYKTTHKYLKVSVTKPVNSKKINSSTIISSTSAPSSSNSSSVISKGTTQITAANNTASTTSTSTTSTAEKADLALADQYKAKAVELSQQAANQSNQFYTISQILSDTVHPEDYYTKLDSQISDYQQQIKALSVKSHDTTSNDYQSLVYHLTKLQNEKASAQKDDEYPKKINTLDKSKVSAYKDKFYQSQNHTNEDSYESPSEAEYFWTLAGKLYNKYNLELDTDWEDGPYTSPSNTKEEIFKLLVEDINNTNTEKPSDSPELQKQKEEQQKLQEQYDKDYASALVLVNQYHENSEKENSLNSELNTMSSNIKAFVTTSSDVADSVSTWQEYVNNQQDALDKIKESNPNYENTNEYQHGLTDLDYRQSMLNMHKQDETDYKQALAAINGDFVAYRAQRDTLQKKLDALRDTNNGYADQLQQLQTKYRSIGLPDEAYKSENIFNLYI